MAEQPPRNVQPPQTRKTVGQILQRYVLAGLVVLVPITVTCYILVVIFQFADGLLGKFINRYLQRAYGYSIPGLGLLLTFLLIVGVGAIISSNMVARRIYRWTEQGFARLPLVRNIYPSIREIAEFFFEKDRRVAFRKVVLVEYPSPGLWSIGFVTNEEPPVVNATLARTVYAILISTPPSPFSGPIIFLPPEKVKFLDITVEEGLKLVMSGGVLVPPATRPHPHPEQVPT